MGLRAVRMVLGTFQFLNFSFLILENNSLNMIFKELSLKSFDLQVRTQKGI